LRGVEALRCEGEVPDAFEEGKKELGRVRLKEITGRALISRII